MSTWPLSTELVPNFDGGLMRAKYLKGGLRSVKTRTLRNSLPFLYRFMSTEETTICFVESENQFYKLINNPTGTTTDADWEVINFSGVSSALTPIGSWHIDNTTPVLTDGDAAGRNGQFYFVTGAVTPDSVTFENLFEGNEVTLVDGNLIVSVGTHWITVSNSTAWNSIDKPQVIIDYVNGEVIAHTHTASEITDLAAYLTNYLQRSQTADHTVAFNTVPDDAIIELEFLKTHYYTYTEIDDLISGFSTNFLSLDDTPSSYSGQASKILRVNAGQTALEFVDNLPLWSNIQSKPTTLGGYGITDGVATGSFYSNPSWITSLAASKITGVLSLANLPASAIETVYVYGGVEVLPENAGLTLAQVQNGDVVKMNNTGIMYVVTNDLALNSSASFIAFNAGIAASVPWTGITDKPTTVDGFGITDAWKIGGNSGGNSVIGLLDASDLHIRAGVSGRISITSGGNITFNSIALSTLQMNFLGSNGFFGLGIATPTQRFHMNGGNALIENNFTGVANMTVSNTNVVDANSRARFVATNGTVQSEFGTTGFSTVGYVGTISNHSFQFRTNSITSMRLSAIGNLYVGGNVDATARLFVKDTSSDSATNSFQISNSNNKNVLQIRSAGYLYLGNAGAGITKTTDGFNQDIDGHSWIFSSSFSTTSGVPGYIFGFGTPSQSSSSIVGTMSTSGKFDPSSGAHDFAFMRLNHEINTTGSWVGTVTGFDYNPTLTSVTGLTHYAALFRSGSVGIGTGAPTATLHVVGSILSSSGDVTLAALATGDYYAQTTNKFRSGGNLEITAVNTSTLSATVNALTASVRNQIATTAGTTNNVVSALVLRSTNGTQIGAGAALDLQIQNNSPTFVNGARIASEATAIISSGTADMVFSTLLTGTLTERMRMNHTGVGIGVTPTGKLQVRGGGLTTGILTLFENSAGTERFKMLDDGTTNITGPTTITTTGTNPGYTLIINSGAGGDMRYVNLTGTFTKSSGTNVFAMMVINPTVNSTGTHVGQLIGIDYNPTITSYVGTAHIGLRVAKGQIIFGENTTPTASTRFDLRGIASGNIFRGASEANVERLLLTDTGDFTLNSGGGGLLALKFVAATGALQFGLSSAQSTIVSPVSGIMQYSSGNVANSSGVHRFILGNITPTSGDAVGLSLINGSFAPTSGTATYIMVGIKNSLNPTGSYLGSVIGIDYNPTVTTTTGLTHYAIKTATGSILFGNASSDAVTALTRLDVRGETGGIIFRGANANNTQIFTLDTSGVISHTTGGLSVADTAFLTSTSFARSSGTTTVTHFKLTPTLNMTGTYLGSAIGIDYSPSITNAVGLTHIAAWFRSGFVGIGSTSPTNPLYVKGLGATTSTFSFKTVNSAVVDTFAVRDDGALTLGSGGGVIGRTSNGNAQLISGQSWMFSLPTNAVTTAVPALSIDFISSSTSGIRTVTGTTSQASFAPTSGNAVFSYLTLNHSINATGTYGGQIIGIDYNPTLTSLTGVTHYAALFRSGKVGIGLAAPTATLHSRGEDATSANSAAQFENSLGQLIAKFRNDLTLELGGTSAILEVNSGIPSGNAAIRFLANQALGYRFQDSALNDYINMRSTTADKAVIMRQPVEYDYGQTEKRITRQITITSSTTNSAQNVVFEFTLADADHYDIKVLHAEATATDGTSITSLGVDAADCRKVAATNIQSNSVVATQSRLPSSVVDGGFNWNFDTTTQKVQYRFQNTSSGTRTFVVWVDISYVKRLTPEA